MASPSGEASSHFNNSTHVTTEDYRVKNRFDPSFTTTFATTQPSTKRARTEVSGEVSACTPVPAKKRRSPPQQTRELPASLGTNAAINDPCEESASDESAFPLMIDIMSGPNAPLATGFMMAQWRTASIDRIFGEHHDLSDSKVQI